MKAPKSVRKFSRKGHLDKLKARKGRRKEAPPSKSKQASGSGSIKASDLKGEEKSNKRGAQDAFLDAELDMDGSDGEEDSSDSLDLDDIDEEEEMIEGEDDEEEGEADEEEAEAADEEDGDEDLEEPVAKDNKRLKSEIGVHKVQLEALRARDPEFYAYLQQTDANLLSFSDDEEEGDGEDEDDDEKDEKEAEEEQGGDEDGDGEDAEEGKEEKKLIVTTALMNKWCKVAKKQAPLGTVRNLLKAYRIACNQGSGEEVATTMKIASASVYNNLMLFVLKEVDSLLRRLLGIEKKEPTAVTSDDLTRSNKWRKVGPLVKSYWGVSLHLIATVTDAPLLAFVLRRLRASISLVSPFKKLGERFLKACLGIFGSSEEVPPRVQAFLAIRALALTIPQPYLELSLKGM